MTTNDRFDSVVATWLQANGPADIRPAALDAALAEAARRPQRRGIRALLGTPDPTAWRLRVVTAVALGAIVVAGTVLVFGTASPRPVVPTPTPTHPARTDPPPSPAPTDGLVSPDGAAGLITITDRSSQAIHVVRPSDAASWSFDRSPIACAHLTPDGRQVAYTTGRFAPHAISTWIATGEDQGVAADTGNSGYRDGSWSPNGAYLAYRTAAQFKIVDLFGVAPGTQAVFSSPDETLLSEGSWSPDSNWVAIALGQGNDFRVVVLSHSADVMWSYGPFPLSALTATDGGFGAIAWSPDGTRILLASDVGLDSLDVRTGISVRVGGFGAADMFIEASPWSHDGAWLAVRDGAGSVLNLLGADGSRGANGPVLRFASLGYFARWSPADDILAAVTPEGLATIGTDGRIIATLADVPSDAPFAFAWAPDGSAIVLAVSHGSNDGLVVTKLDPTGGAAPIVLATFPTGSDPASQLLCANWDASATPPNEPSGQVTDPLIP
jgi:WD40 repeat protein